MKVMNRLSETVEFKKIAARNSAERFGALSRHGVVAVERAAKGPRIRANVRRTMSQLAGSIFIGLGVALFVHARLGVPAYDVMLTALRDRYGITLGQAGWLFTGALFLVAALLGRRPSTSGLVYLLANGAAVDLWMPLIRDPEQLGVRILFVVLGTVALAAGVALVIHAGLTGGAIELLTRAAEDRGIDQFTARRVLEVLVVIGGVLLGGDIGVATVFFVLTMATILRSGEQALADHRAGRQARLS